MTFNERTEGFQDEVGPLQTKYKLEMYPVQVVSQTGELVTIIKLRDLMPPDPISEVGSPKTYEDKSKKGTPTNKKA